MNTIKVYDVDAFVKSNYPEYQAFRYEKAAVFEGQHGVVFAEHEAVHQRKGTLTDKVVIPLCKRPSPGHIAIVSTAELRVSLDEIVSDAPFEETTIEAFFKRRNYNIRCQDNYATLMGSLRTIGFDLHGYFVEQPSVDDQIQAAVNMQDNSRRDLDRAHTERDLGEGQSDRER